MYWVREQIQVVCALLTFAFGIFLSNLWARYQPTLCDSPGLVTFNFIILIVYTVTLACTVPFLNNSNSFSKKKLF
jgi:hypothetical protein